MPRDPQTQLELFREAVDALGGQHATARYLKVTERQVRYLLAGDKRLHDGFLRDIAAALARHGAHCRELERQLTPAFAANLTANQLERQGRPDRRRYDYSDGESEPLDFSGQKLKKVVRQGDPDNG